MNTPPTPIRDRDLVFLDTETSGLEPLEHEVLEIALFRVTPDLQTLVATFVVRCALQWPERASPKALEVNRYDPAKWAESAISIRRALQRFDGYIDESVVVVGQNPQFDWAFLREAHRREAMPMPNTKYLIDVAAIAWPLVVRRAIEKVSLEVVCQHFGVSNDGSHGALVDVWRTMQVYTRLLDLPPPFAGLPFEQVMRVARVQP